MIQASKVTFPFRSGRPPLPTVWLVSSASSTLTPCSTASSALPPLSNTSQALALAFIKFQVQTTKGRMGAVVGVGATVVSAALGSVLQEARVEAATMPAVAMPEFLRNLRLSMDRLINFSKVKYNDMLLEICANSLESALNAQSAGADRIELCAELGTGGITPSAGTLKLAKQRLDIPVHVLIRPRSGHFTYSGPEFEVMQADILACRELGLQGIVSGVLREDFSLDLERTKALVELAAPMHFTFHRAFDWVRAPLRALEQLEGIGVSTVLTSGGRATALEGL